MNSILVFLLELFLYITDGLIYKFPMWLEAFPTYYLFSNFPLFIYLFIHVLWSQIHKKINVDQRGHAAAYLMLIGIFAENL